MAIRSNFAGLAVPSGVAAQATQDNINAEIDKIITLVTVQATSTTGGSAMPHPEFDRIHPEMQVKLTNELNALKDAIDDMATA